MRYVEFLGQVQHRARLATLEDATLGPPWRHLPSACLATKQAILPPSFHGRSDCI